MGVRSPRRLGKGLVLGWPGLPLQTQARGPPFPACPCSPASDLPEGTATPGPGLPGLPFTSCPRSARSSALGSEDASAQWAPRPSTPEQQCPSPCSGLFFFTQLSVRGIKHTFFFLIRRLPLMVGRMPPRQDAHVQIPGTCDCVPLHGRRDFAAVITDLKIGRLSWIIPWAWSNHRSPSELRTSSQWKHNWCCSRGSAGVTREKEGRSDGERRWPGRS